MPESPQGEADSLEGSSISRSPPSSLPSPPNQGVGLPGRGHTSSIVSLNHLFNSRTFHQMLWLPIDHLEPQRQAGPERVFRDTASLLDAGGCIPGRGRRGEPTGGQAFCHKRGSRADVGVGVGQGITVPARLNTPVSTCVQCCSNNVIIVNWNGPKGLGMGWEKEKRWV